MPVGLPSRALPRLFLDSASAVPLRAAVIDALHHALDLPSADPGRNYAEGRIVRDAVEVAREQIGASLKLASSRVTFFSGIPEAVATALSSIHQRRHGATVLSAVERDSFHQHAAALGEVTTVPVNDVGLVDLGAVERALATNPAVLCCQWANQETGIIQPIGAIVAMAKAASVPLVIDATQAGRLAPEPWIADVYVMISSEGLGGPAGITALTVPRGSVLRPLLFGGAQERGRRAGLEPTLLAVGFGAAALDNAAHRSTEATELRLLLDQLIAKATAVEGVRVIGPTLSTSRLPDLVSLEVDGVASEAIVVGLDRRGVAVHSGSACSSETFEPSPVLAAMGSDAQHSVRLSVSWATPWTCVEDFDRAFSETVRDLRSLAKG